MLQRPEDLLASIPEGSTFTIEAPIVAGDHCALRFRVERANAEPERGIGVLSFDPSSLAPVTLTLNA